jgi:hypothetical protein
MICIQSLVIHMLVMNLIMYVITSRLEEDHSQLDICISKIEYLTINEVLSDSI